MLPDFFGELFLFRIKGRNQKQIGITQHRGDGIVEFVRSASHQSADRGQFLGFRDLCLQTFQIGEGLPRVG